MGKLNIKKPVKILGIVLGVICVIISVFLLRRAFSNITYSNLNDADALNITVDYLTESGVPQENIDVFKEQVQFTNEFLSELPNLQGEFITKKGAIVKYDRNMAFNLFRTAILPDDINCRLTAWNLIKDLVKVDAIDETIELSEESALEYYPSTGFSEGDKEAFWGVFKGIPAGAIHTTSGYATIIKEAWANRNLEFEDSNRKLVSCFGYSFENKWLEAVHVGVMIEQDDQVVFIEKVNPAEPFQVSIFKNEKELNYYLKQRLLDYFVLQPIIMVNDERL
ncbi:MAG TPA: hypothetical protein DCY20_07200 [Firmicutes bacterium]|nr:hypothetical protein [Bacillota bacterium]